MIDEMTAADRIQIVLLRFQYWRRLLRSLEVQQEGRDLRIIYTVTL